MGGEIRLGQLIVPFGPGSIYTDKNAVPTVMCGLDYWHHKENENGEPESSSASKKKSKITEPRLSELLKVAYFLQPPEYVSDKNNPDLSRLKVQGLRFPRWYVNNATGQLKRFNLESQRLEHAEKGHWKPVRFLAVCSAGHMSDFPWKKWVGCSCSNETGLMLRDSGGATLDSILVQCTQCKTPRKSLARATSIDLKERTSGLTQAGITQCSGERPWLGEAGTQVGCNEVMAGVLINQSNIYFPKTTSSIYLPDLMADSELREIQEILKDKAETTTAKLFFQLGDEEAGMDQLKKGIAKELKGPLPKDKVIKNAFDNLGRGRIPMGMVKKPSAPDSDFLAFRRTEFNILRNPVVEGVSSELRIMSSVVPSPFKNFFNKVNLVERLRETRVFFGFDRLVRSDDPFAGMPESAMNQLFLRPPDQAAAWLPAVKNYGEGIYIEFSENAISKWLKLNRDWLIKRYDVNFINRMHSEPLLIPPSNNVDWKWAARYQLIHTFSHILINQLVFESGYSSASLKERLFVSSDSEAPMGGLLIYTASGDSDGSLGGLVRLGRPDLFESLLRRAVSRASWCSADPVCSENLGGAGTRLVNMAACHACTLLPETACETINNGLDRASVVGTPDDPDVGFLSELREDMF